MVVYHIMLPQITVKQIFHASSIAVDANKAAGRSYFVVDAVSLQPSSDLDKRLPLYSY